MDLFTLVLFLLVDSFSGYGVDAVGSFIDYELMIPCDAKYEPKFCNYPNTTLESLTTGEDFERCAPSLLPLHARNFFWGAAGRKLTYKWNMEAFRRIKVISRVMRDVSQSDISATVLGEKITSPIGISPVALQNLAHPDGELATARATGSRGLAMIVSSLASTRLEDVAVAAKEAAKANGRSPLLWMQTAIFKNRTELMQIVRRAERADFRAIVITCDWPIASSLTCDCRNAMNERKFPNLSGEEFDLSKIDGSVTFRDLAWLKKNTKLPIVAKGILTGSDAIKVVQAGASAILVSNHGGRQLDGHPPTIEVLPGIVKTLRHRRLKTEVYLDGGVRNGNDVFKALAAGARAVFIGRPAIWGLAVAGESGVRKVLDILTAEFNETMIVAGYSKPSDISSKSILFPDSHAFPVQDCFEHDDSEIYRRNEEKCH